MKLGIPALAALVFLAGGWDTARSAPSPEARTAPATRPAFSIDVTQAGAIGDGNTLNTAALQKAIDACAARGGGTLDFPAGRYVTGTIRLTDNVTLRLERDATLLGSTDSADYVNVDPFISGDGAKLGYALVAAIDAHNVGIEGPGMIDGQGKTLVHGAGSKAPVRPFLLRWVRCQGVSIRDVTLRDPAAWTNHLFQCSDVVVDHVTVRSYGFGQPNNDGIDIDSCARVRVSGCDIESGDDAVCLKTTSPLPCHDVVVTDCTLKTRCNGVKFGTESIGDFTDVHVSRCAMHDIGMSGLAVYAVDGSNVSDVSVEDVTMDKVAVAVSVRLGARLKTFRPGDVAKPVGTLRGVTVRRLRATGAKTIGLLVNGVPGHPVESLTLDDVAIEVVGGATAAPTSQPAEKEKAYPEFNMFGRTLPAYGAYLRHLRGATLRDVRVTAAEPDVRPAVIVIDGGETTPGEVSTTATTRPSELIR